MLTHVYTCDKCGIKKEADEDYLPENWLRIESDTSELQHLLPIELCHACKDKLFDWIIGETNVASP